MINMHNNNKNNGFTLIELMSTVAVGMIMISMAAPNLQGLLQGSKITALHNELLSSLNFARSTAITTGSWTTLCHSNSAGTACQTPSSTWEHGWIVFPDKDNDGVVDSNERVLATVSGVPSGINIISNKNRISYGARGYAVGYAGKITFCDKSDDNHKGGMIISANGRTRKATSNDSLDDCSSV